MAKTKKDKTNLLAKYQHILIPSTIGGAVAYILSGFVFMGLAVFASVWVGNILGSSVKNTKSK